MNLGVDIGRVLIAPSGRSNADTSFIGGSVEDALASPPYEYMFDVMPQLVRHFSGRVWLISKARPPMQEKTRLWLLHHQFYERTGMSPENLRFCLERHEKAVHCEDLGITHFIDDRVDVLLHLKGLVKHRYLFGPQKLGTATPKGVECLVSWSEVARRFLQQT